MPGPRLLGRFSTMTGCPKGAVIPAAISRAIKSLPPPGAEVTMRMGFDGNSSPHALVIAQRAPMMVVNAMLVRMNRLHCLHVLAAGAEQRIAGDIRRHV